MPSNLDIVGSNPAMSRFYLSRMADLINNMVCKKKLSRGGEEREAGEEQSYVVFPSNFFKERGCGEGYIPQGPQGGERRERERR